MKSYGMERNDVHANDAVRLFVVSKRRGWKLTNITTNIVRCRMR